MSNVSDCSVPVVAWAPLVTMVAAPRTSRAGIVLRLMRQLAKMDPVLSTLDFKVEVDGLEQGFFLCDCPGSSCSLKYEILINGFKLDIGRDIPDEQRLHVAQSILAMIKRGRNWTDATGVVHKEAYGPAPVSGSGKIRRDRRRAKRALRWRDRQVH